MQDTAVTFLEEALLSDRVDENRFDSSHRVVESVDRLGRFDVSEQSDRFFEEEEGRDGQYS